MRGAPGIRGGIDRPPPRNSRPRADRSGPLLRLLGVTLLIRSTAPILGRLAALALFVSGSVGCYSDSAAFITRAAKLSCVNARECERDAYEAAFDTMRDCRDSAENELQEQLDSLESAGCEYIAENGRDCIHAMFKIRKQCDVGLDAELEDACGAVFVCPDGAPRMGIVPSGGRAVIERAGDVVED